MTDRLLGGVEGGGTKFLAAVARCSGSGAPQILDRFRVATTGSPAEALQPIAEWLAQHELEGLGIATFGPLDLAAGSIRDTPKPGWSGIDIRGDLTAQFDAPPPTAFDTDVNGAALGEWRWGAGRGARVSLYVTVGTGIGGGVIIDGAPLHGLGHPEMGHISVPRHPDDDLRSTCPHHADCLEGLASGPAISSRAGKPADQLGDDDPAWDLETHYLAHGLAEITTVLSPEVIAIGGGVLERTGLFDRVAARLDEVLGGYVETPAVVLPRFGQEAGLMGAVALADRAASGA